MTAPDRTLCLFCGLPMGEPDGCDCPAPTVRRRTTRTIIGLGDLIADLCRTLDREDRVVSELVESGAVDLTNAAAFVADLRRDSDLWRSEHRLPGIEYRPAGCACGVCRGR